MPSKEYRELLNSIAAKVADRRELDWDELGDAHPGLAPLVRQFAVLDRIAAQHESVEISPQATRAAGDSGPLGPLPLGGESLLEDPTSWGPLELREKLGEGSFGQVFRAFDPVLQREVALKLGRADVRASGAAENLHLEEARRLASVRHPNVVAVHGIEVHQGRIGLWTDLLEGRTLEQILEASGPLPADNLIRIGIHLCRALTAIHGAGVLHGDIKAANVMREPSGNVVLMDFGAGRRFAGTAAPVGLEDERLFGTPLVLAPEVLEGEPPTIAADLYSLGVLLYRLAAGRYPVKGSSVLDQLLRLRNEGRIPLEELRPDLPPILARAIARTLSYDPRERYETAAQLESSLTTALGEREPELADPARAAREGKTELPVPATRFLGRRKELLEIRELLDSRPWVTLIGPGGSGKTRLALEAASGLADRYPGGVRWIDLSHLTDPHYLVSEIARSLSVRARAGSNDAEALVESLRSRSALLVIDNAEHLREACRDWAESVIAQCPRLALLVTSREPLGGAREEIFDVGPLAVPPDPLEEGFDWTELAQYDSVRLFVDRAYLDRPDFRLTKANAEAVAAICRKLDGLPLALELAAARVRTLSPEEIIRRLEQSLRILSDRDAPITRHATLHAMLEWSYELLTEEERTLLQRLSVFRGGWTLMAAEHVCADESEDSPVPEIPSDVRGVEASSTASPEARSIGENEVLELIGSLVRRSLVRFEQEDRNEEAGRYRMFEVVRQFAREKLCLAGAESLLLRRYIRYYLLLAVEGDRRLFGPEQASWNARFAREHDNLHAALALTSKDRSDPTTGLRLATALGLYWALRGLYSLGRAQAVSQLERPECRDGSKERAALLTWAGILSYEVGDFADGIRFHEESKVIQEARGDRLGIATSLGGLGDIAFRIGELARAGEYFEAAVAILRDAGNPQRLGVLLNKLAIYCLSQNDPTRARQLQEENVALQRACGNLGGVALALTHLGTVHFSIDETDRALDCYTEALAIRRRTGEKSYMTTTLTYIGKVHLVKGRLDAALPFLRESLLILQEAKRPGSIFHCLDVIALHAELSARFEESLTLLSAGFAVRESAGEVIPEGERLKLDQRIRSLREKVDERAANGAWTAGQAMTMADAISYGFAYIDGVTEREPAGGQR